MYTFQYSKARSTLHPEMFDENGNMLPDEILAVRFENDYERIRRRRRRLEVENHYKVKEWQKKDYKVPPNPFHS